MEDYKLTTEEIDEAYYRYIINPKTEQNTFFEILHPYIKNVIELIIKQKNYVDEQAAEDLTQEVLLAIFQKEIYKFRGECAKFSTFCYAIAKNKALSYVKKSLQHQMCDLEDIENSKCEAGNGSEIFNNPEKIYLMQETRLEMLGILKSYLRYMMERDDKPYRTVSCCFTLIIFHKYNPKTTMLGSPKWSYKKLKECTVKAGADLYVIELRTWFRQLSLLWGKAFGEGLAEKEYGVYVRDLVFGEHFTVKDFENWSIRLRKEVKKALIAQEVECDVTETSFDCGL